VAARQNLFRTLAAMFIYPLALLAMACGGSSSAPSSLLSGTTTPTTPTPTPPVSPTPTSVVVTGRNQLSALGEKSQLTATARYADGTSKDVTSEATWASELPSVFTVSAGEITTVGFGISGITARLLGRTGYLQAAATPPGTFIFWGRAREPGMGGMGGVRVIEMRSGQSQATAADGIFQFPGLTAARYRFEREGFETLESDAAPLSSGSIGMVSFTDLALQRVVRFAAGETLQDDLAPHDLTYTVGADTCYPCKLIRVTSTGGTLHVNATATGATTGVNLWINGTRFAPEGAATVADARVPAGETILYVGYLGETNRYVRFTLATSLNP
jgi:hypothetical protein